MSFFETIKDEIRKEHEEKRANPENLDMNRESEREPENRPNSFNEQNNLPSSGNNGEKPKKMGATTIDFLKDQAKRYSEDSEGEKQEKEEKQEENQYEAQRSEPQKQEFEPHKPEPKPEPEPKHESENKIVSLLEEIRNQNREMISVLKEMRRPQTSTTRTERPGQERRLF